MGCRTNEAMGKTGFAVPLDAPSFVAGAPSSIRLDRLTGKPADGKVRKLRYIDLDVESNFTTAGGGAIAAKDYGNVFSNIGLRTRFGAMFTNINGRSMRSIWHFITGRRVFQDAAAMGASATTTQRFCIRIMFSDPSLRSPDDRALPVTLLPSTLDLTFGTATDIGTNVTINSVQLRPIARYYDSDDESAPPPYFFRRDNFNSRTPSLSAGNVFAAFIDETDESITEAEVTTFKFVGPDDDDNHHQQKVQDWNADHSHSTADEIAPNNATFFPMYWRPGRIGQQNSYDVLGNGDDTIPYNIPSGSLTNHNVTYGYFEPSDAVRRTHIHKLAYPHLDLKPGGRHVLGPKTRNGKMLPLSAMKAKFLPWNAYERIDASKVVRAASKAG